MEGQEAKTHLPFGRRARRNSGSRQIAGRRGGQEAWTARGARKAEDEVSATTETAERRGVDQGENC